MNEIKLQPGWLERQIKGTREFIKNTTLEQAFEMFGAYSANEEPKLESDDDLINYLIATKPFQIWEERGQYPRYFEGFELKENAIKLGKEYSLKPQVYGQLSLRDLNGTYTLGIFENGEFEPKEQSNVWVDTRPSWDAYFMSEAFRVSRRSLDKDTKHGCVFVIDKRIVSTGYNSPPPGFYDKKADLTRPGKYLIFEHSERNAICNAARAGVRTLGATCYVTGFPCSDCYRAMWNAGIESIIYAPISLEYSTKDHISKLEAAQNGPKLIKFSKERMKEVIKILDDEYDYIMEKVDFTTPESN